MSVGLFDYDFLRSKELYFNLDLMKSAGELRKKREITVLSPLFAPEKYSSFYVFQDFPHDNTFFRTDLNDDVKFFGRQFTKGIYVPKDLKTENSVPDATIYEKLRDCVPDKQKIRFTSLMNGEHIRLSLDGKTVNPKFESQIGTFHRRKRHCFIYDYDLGNVTGAAAALHVLMDKYNFTFDNKFPLILDTNSNLKEWSDLNYTSDLTNKIQLVNVTDAQLYGLKDNPKFCSRLEHKIAPERTTTNQFLIEYLPKIFKQVLFFREYGLRIRLNIDNLYLVDTEYLRLLHLLYIFVLHPEFTSFIQFLKYYGTAGPGKFCDPQDARDSVARLGKDNYPLFCDLYTKSKVIFKGGEFVYDRT